MKFQLVAASLLLAGGSVAMANQADQDQQPVQQSAATAAVPSAQLEVEALDEDDEMQEVVCRTERITGSLSRRRRTCMTRGEWAELERASGQGHSENVRGASGSQCIPNDPTRPQC